jgi:uncharacterized protein with von Willebrand factor type A (vWA) domain
MSYFIEPKSDAFFKSGLAKSAFYEKIYESLPLDYYLPFVQSTQRVFATFRGRFYPKFYQAHDAFMMFYQPYPLVFQSLKKSNKAAPLWRLVVEKAVSSAEFAELNSITRKSSELSILAAVRFLRTLLYRLDVERLQQQYKDALNALSQQSSQKTLTQQSALSSLIQLVDEAARDAVNTAIEAVREYKESADSAEEAISVLSGGRGGSSFSKEALSVIRFLEDPDKFRKHVKLLKYARVFYSKFLSAVPTSVAHEQVVSIYGGVNGVTRMLSEKQISDILPSELALTQLGNIGRALLALKIAQKQLMTYQHAASVKPVVFVDKSGSMAENFRPREKESVDFNVPKISVAAGLALALYRKLNADVYLFDTEIERVNPSKVVEVLLKIEADGGTDIDPVLEEVVKLGKQEYLYLIISDGITEASEGVLEKFRESGLAKRTKLILVPPIWDRYNWIAELKRYNNVMHALNVAEFESVAKRALESL